ncbi:MAG: hypothetical protein HUU60_12850, partial [Armatimonadetes bacterium]|nr:hypothetical protein [Armatimonadota bacterium]
LAGATNEDFSRREFNGNLAAKGFAQADVAGEIGGFVLESAPGSGLLMAGYGRDGRGRPISDCDRILEGVSVFPLAGAASRAGKAVKSGSEALSNLSRAAKKDLYSKLSSKYGLGKDRVKHILQRHYDQFVRLDPSITPDQVLDIGYNVGSRGANFVRRQADGRVVYQANLTIGSTQVRVTSVMEGHCLVTVFIND